MLWVVFAVVQVIVIVSGIQQEQRVGLWSWSKFIFALGFAALKPSVQVVGVQSDGYPLWQQAFATNGPPTLTPGTIADGTSAPFNPVMFERLCALVHEWVLVPEAMLRRTVARLATEVKVVAEGAGALAYAAMIQQGSSPRTVAILSGGNLDASRLAELLTE